MNAELDYVRTLCTAYARLSSILGTVSKFNLPRQQNDYTLTYSILVYLGRRQILSTIWPCQDG